MVSLTGRLGSGFLAIYLELVLFVQHKAVFYVAMQPKNTAVRRDLTHSEYPVLII